MKKLLSLILFILIQKLSLENFDYEERYHTYDDNYYSEKIKKILHKSGLDKKKTIEKDEYANAFMISIDNSLKGLNFQIFKKSEKEKYMDNLLEQIFYKLSEKENDDIDMKEALNLYEPNKILKSAEDIMKQLGYGDLLEKITYEVIEGDINNNKKDKRENKDNNSNKNKNKKISKKNKTEKKINTDL